jgi:ADP-ribosylglycohydrolase
MIFSRTSTRLVVPLSFCCLAALIAVATSIESDVPTLTDKIRGAFFGALVSDALCLGSHYEYDAKKIKTAYGGTMIERYMAPGEQMGGQTHGVGWGARNYHPGTKAGDQTDYGEYNILVLEHLAQNRPGQNFEIADLLPHWKKRLTDGTWKQWVCTQTKLTLQQVSNGLPVDQLGGNSNAMALRYASIFAYYDSEDQVVDAALKSMFTHREQTALLGNEFFARVTYRVIHENLSPVVAIESVSRESHPWIKAKVKQAIAKVKEATDPNQPLSQEEFVDDLALTSMARMWDVGKSEPIKVGKASPTEGTLPGAVYFILKYQDDFIRATKANAMVGGDNASRSIAIGMVLGAYHGAQSIPDTFKAGLNQWDHCEQLLDTLPLLKEKSAVLQEL